MRRLGVIISAALLLISMGSCAKVALDSDYSVRIWTEIRPSERAALTSAEVWADYLDTTEWYVASYADALDKRVTSKKDQSTRVLNMQGLRGAGDATFYLNFTRKPVMILAFDTEQPMFAWCDGNMKENLTGLDLPVVFQPWMSDSTYIQGNRWRITNEDTEVPVKCTYSLYPRQIKKEGGADERIPNIVSYMLTEVDTLQWTVASLEDARAGTLTSRSDPAEKRPFDLNGRDSKKTLDPEDEKSMDFKFEIEGNSRDIIFILADQEQEMYAFGGVDLWKNPQTASDKVWFRLFRPNQTYWNAEKDYRWQVVMGDVVVPEDPDDPDDPDEGGDEEEGGGAPRRGADLRPYKTLR